MEKNKKKTDPTTQINSLSFVIFCIILISFLAYIHFFGGG